jgi:pheromone a factor receptor
MFAALSLLKIVDNFHRSRVQTFIHRRLSFAMHLDVSNSALKTSHHLRLMAMSAVDMIWSISFAIWFTITNVPLRPWINWDYVHSNFSGIDIYLAVFTPLGVTAAYYAL